MISLIQLLIEQTLKPKAIVLGGAAGSGKSYITNNMLGNIKNGIFKSKTNSTPFTYLNPDEFVEKQNLPLANAMMAFKELFQDVKNKNQNILWDTTAANIKNTLKQLEGYDVFMVMVYTHPIVSILRNFERDRSLPFKAVLKTWDQVYNNIEEYRKMFGDNFTLIQNIPPGFEKQIQEFNTAAQQGKETLIQYLENLIQQNPDKFKSSFSKEFEFDTPEIEKAFNQTLPQTSYSSKDENILKDIKKEFQKEFQKLNTEPDSNFLEKKIISARNTQNRNEQNYIQNIEGIVSKLTSPQFKQILQPSSETEVQSKLNKFIGN